MGDRLRLSTLNYKKTSFINCIIKLKYIFDRKYYSIIRRSVWSHIFGLRLDQFWTKFWQKNGLKANPYTLNLCRKEVKKSNTYSQNSVTGSHTSLDVALVPLATMVVILDTFATKLATAVDVVLTVGTTVVFQALWQTSEFHSLFPSDQGSTELNEENR